ncbi:hypothetical protein M2140_000133 [Clostridiales Family XIII bacterium PM5-7]
MQKILTIDFDVVMAPSIDTYNNLIPGAKWEELNKMPMMKNLQADYIHYQRLTKLVLSLSKQMPREDIFFIENHGKIVDLVEHGDDIGLINIDHHHDIKYPKNKVPEGICTCGNWVSELLTNSRSVGHLWINNPTSKMPDEDVSGNYIFEHALLEDYDLQKIGVPDKMFLCLSEPWIPPQYRPLFFLWVDMLSVEFDHEYLVDFSMPRNEGVVYEK